MEHPSTRLTAAAAALCAAAALAGCANQSVEEPAESATAEETPQSQTQAQTQPSSSAPTSTTSQSSNNIEVSKVAEEFSTLAPAELFDKFDECVVVDRDSSYECTSTEAGEFQFFNQESKAASATELLTKLRGSEVVEEDGNRIVGWSSLGNSAIVTVVDNSKGQVMQRLATKGSEDPRQLIEEFGLAGAAS